MTSNATTTILTLTVCTILLYMIILEMFGQAQAKAPETPQVEGLRCVVNNAKKMLDEVLLTRNDLRASLREDRKKGVEIQASNVQMLRRLDVRVKDLEKRLR